MAGRYILCGVEKNATARPGPARGLYLGLAVTILAVLVYAGYITLQFAGLRELQSELVDRNRRDSLQLLRIQNDLNSVGLAMRDMLDASEPYPLIAWSAQFDRIHTDLDDALKLEAPLSEAAPSEISDISCPRRWINSGTPAIGCSRRRRYDEATGAGADSGYVAAAAGGAEFGGFAAAGAK